MAVKTASASVKKSTNKFTVKTVTESKPVSSLMAIMATLKSMPIVGIVVAEFVGTFMLVASILSVQASPLFVAFALIGVVFIISGATSVHLNPAMTVGALVTKKINAVYALGYILAQVMGAIVAWLVMDSFLKGTDTLSAYSNSSLFHAAKLTAGKEWYIFFAEMLGAGILSLGFASALRAKKDKVTAALAYGFATLVALIVAGSVTTLFLSESNTGLSFLNPATAIAANGLSWNVWPISIYIVAPVLGSIVGFLVHDLVQSQSSEK